MADKYIKDLTETTDALVNADYMLVEKADNSGTKISQFSNIASSVANKILVNNRTTTASGYALDARQGKAIDDAFFRGRNNAGSSLTETDLIALPPGSYLYNTAYSWLPETAGQYGTITSVQDVSTGGAGYGYVLLTDTVGRMYVRHHTASAWHTAWVCLSPPSFEREVKSIAANTLTLNTWNNITSYTRTKGYIHLYVAKISGSAPSGSRYVLQQSSSLQCECQTYSNNGAISGSNTLIIVGDGATGYVQFYPTATPNTAISLQLDHLMIPT